MTTFGRIEKYTKKRKGCTWCGPAALAYLLDITYEDAEAQLIAARKKLEPHRKRHALLGCPADAMRACMPKTERVRHRKVAILDSDEPKVCFSKWLDWYRRPGHTYLVHITGHWVLVGPEFQYDNQHGLQPHGKFHGRCQVRNTYRIEK